MSGGVGGWVVGGRDVSGGGGTAGWRSSREVRVRPAATLLGVGNVRAMGNRKVLATIGSGPMADVLAVSGPTMRDYADRHGYAFVAGDGDSAGRPPAWGKVLLIRRLLDEYETVLWIDADAIVLDSGQDIADELGRDDFQALVSHDLPGDWAGYYGNPGEEMPNSGVWLLRGTRARDFIDAVWDSSEFIDHEWWENGAVMHLLGFDMHPCKRARETEWSDGTVWLEPTWNSHTMYTGLKPARIRHYAGVDNRMRARRMRADLGLGHIPLGAWRLYWDLRVRGYVPLKVGAKRIAKRVLRR